MSLLTLRGLFERLRAPSQSQKGHFYEKMKLKKSHQNSWNWQKSAQTSEIFVMSRGICQSMGVSSRKGEHFRFWTKMVHTKIKTGQREQWDCGCQAGWREPTSRGHFKRRVCRHLPELDPKVDVHAQVRPHAVGGQKDAVGVESRRRLLCRHPSTFALHEDH